MIGRVFNSGMLCYSQFDLGRGKRYYRKELIGMADDRVEFFKDPEKSESYIKRCIIQNVGDGILVPRDKFERIIMDVEKPIESMVGIH